MTLLNCGHEPTPTPGGIGSGVAYAANGATLCYPCADETERAFMASSDRLLAYVSSDGKSVQTWSGGTLATITALWTIGRGFGRSTIYGVNAVAPDGSRWYGRNSGTGMRIMLRRNRTA
jgi:hypothetical protein